MPRSQTKRARRMRERRLGESQDETDARVDANKRRRQEQSPETSQRRLAENNLRRQEYHEREERQGNRRPARLDNNS